MWSDEARQVEDMSPTKKQQQVFEALLFLTEKGERPTVREVGALVGLSSPATVMKHLRGLEEEGLISLSGKSRGIRIVPPGFDSQFDSQRFGSQHSDAVPKPLSRGNERGIPVAGRIAAGRPLEAVEESAMPELLIDPRLFSGSGELMSLRVSGDSMIDAGILDGDYVIIRRQAVIEEGEIAAVEIDGDVTLKRWKGSRPGEGGQEVQLVGANANFPPIELNAEDGKDVRVLGKYVGLVRGEGLAR